MSDVKLSSVKYVVAVSGGVDSVVLLNMLSKRSNLNLIVAHFDHGIRDDSIQDAKFVAELAKKYKLPFETKREELGRGVSEETARIRRYSFLWSITEKYNAKLITAHHADDVIETIAINLTRGTGWRGLAVLDSEIIRPLTNMTKTEIIDYAKKHQLTWHEDSTNASDDYLRNRIRHKASNISKSDKNQLLNLWQKQKVLKRQVDNEIRELFSDNSDSNYSRYFFINIDRQSAIECLRYITKARLTRPQMVRLLHEIKTIAPNKTFSAGNGIKISFTTRNFTVELIK